MEKSPTADGGSGGVQGGVSGVLVCCRWRERWCPGWSSWCTHLLQMEGEVVSRVEQVEYSPAANGGGGGVQGGVGGVFMC